MVDASFYKQVVDPCGKVAHVSQELGGVEAFVAEPQQVRDFVGSVCHKGKLEGALRTDPRQEVLGYLPGVLCWPLRDDVHSHLDGCIHVEDEAPQGLHVAAEAVLGCS